MHVVLEEADSAARAADRKRAIKALDRFVWKIAYKGQATDTDLLDAAVMIRDWTSLDTPIVLDGYLRGGLETIAKKTPDRYPQTAQFFAESRERAVQQRAERAAEAHTQKVEANRAAVAKRMPMTTTPELPGRVIDEPLSVVSGACVMSRNMFSDMGSDLSSLGGGTLGGIEKAVETARQTAMERLEAAARDLGADAVVGIDMSVQTVSDKAQLVMMLGTAVTLVPPSAE